MAKWLISSRPEGGVSTTYVREGRTTDLGRLPPEQLPKGVYSAVDAVIAHRPTAWDLIHLPDGRVLLILPNRDAEA